MNAHVKVFAWTATPSVDPDVWDAIRTVGKGCVVTCHMGVKLLLQTKASVNIHTFPHKEKKGPAALQREAAIAYFIHGSSEMS